MISERQISLWMAILLIILPASLHAQESDREQVLADDIKRLGEGALRDRVISDEEHTQLLVSSGIPCLKAPIRFNTLDVICS